MSPHTVYVLIYEVLFGETFRRKGPAEKAVLRHKARLQELLQALLQRHGAPSAEALLQRSSGAARQLDGAGGGHPRTARVNTLKLSVDQALALLRKPPASWPAAAAAAGRSVAVDDLLPDLLIFAPGTDLHDHPMVLDSSLVLQSKASCMPAHALSPEPGWSVVDCCAAPGNKTTHAAALMRGRGTVFAFDKDAKRLGRLQANADATGAAGVIIARQADFLTEDPLAPEFAAVRGVILDPSCSGSGTIFSRMDYLLPSNNQLEPLQPAAATATAAIAAADSDGDGGSGNSNAGAAAATASRYYTPGEQDAPRVAQLAKFQKAALSHALRFPSLQRLVYSTCSVWAQENEEVVAAVLPAAAAAGFALVDPFPTWPRRGLPGLLPADADAAKLVRTDPYLDGTDGFFVAVFERRRQTQQQQQQPVESSSPKQQQKQQQQVGRSARVDKGSKRQSKKATAANVSKATS